MKRFSLQSVFPLLAAVFFCAAALAIPAAAGQHQTAASGKPADTGVHPEAVFPQTQYEFDPVMEGVDIKHDFVIENHGNAPLVIQNVRPD